MKYHRASIDDYGNIVLNICKSFDDIPLEDYKNCFKEYWEFIAGYKLKYKPFLIGKNGENISSDCWACEYKCRTSKVFQYCPLKIFRNNECTLWRICPCLDDNSIYTQWKETGDHQIALEIANLEWEDYHETNN